ncbi:MAG TPA: alpha-glucan phosphorylase, partial [Ruminococcaceae bacterium]|nr:alpha-glucan phosphorylase [Oscillospiraceae bacterium]
FDVKLENLYECEPDAGLGNGGLGRLAACYMDALATLNLPAMGYSILYEYGIFKQKIVEGWQTETPDYWLPGGDVWLAAQPERAVEVRFGGEIEEFWIDGHHQVRQKNYSRVLAIPYDLCISGYDSEGVSRLRLWKAKSPGIDMESFNKGDYIAAFGQNSLGEAISKVLYPNDNHFEGKNLRLRQQYFLCCASITDIIRRHISVYGTLANFAEKNAIHINDTHPALAIPELMRVLLDDCGYSWQDAWDIAEKTFGYTNHTVLSEALERWDEDLFKNLLPRLYQIICEINRRFCQELLEKYHLDEPTVSRMSIIQNHQIKMASLCVVVSHSVNGVSKLHSEIIKNSVFNDYYKITPNKFKNVTNGIASRRWLLQSNKGLANLLCETIGDGFKKDFSRLADFKKFADDKQVLGRLAEIKLQNKQSFARYIYDTTGVSINPNSIFDVQVKRLHEYKRQHLNALHILSLYLRLKADPNADIAPRTYIFGAKAAPGYYLAKQIIKLICTLRDAIEADPAIREKLRIVYLEDYRVTLSEILMPAAEISEQISLAGTEASGTGNMKLMLNGAVTLGTMDGANVEIFEAVGKDNIIIFGMNEQQVNKLKSDGYKPENYYNSNDDIRQAIDLLNFGIDGQHFSEIASSLHYSDPYMVLADYDDYKRAQAESARLYSDNERWQKMSLFNIAGSGIFCADRAIKEYAQNIWHTLK